MPKPKRPAKPKSSDTAQNASSPSSPKTSSTQPAQDADTKPTEATQPSSQPETPKTSTPLTGSADAAREPEGPAIGSIGYAIAKITRLEGDLERLGTLTMQILTYIDKQQKSSLPQSPAGNPNLPGQPAGPAGILAQIPPGVIEQGIKLISGLMTQPQEQQRDPFELEIYKGMRESFVEGFKNYVTTVNQNAQIGAQVLEALKSGKLKIEPPEAAKTP